MGRPAKPLKDHLKDGTYRADRHGPIPADIDGPVPPPAKPADLDGEAGEFWDRLSSLLAGVVRDRDAPLMAEMCWHWAELRRIKVEIAKMTPGGKGYTSLLVAAGICTDKFDRIAAKFGLSPGDRARLKVVDQGPAKPKVATRPLTRLDKGGKPK